MNKGKIGLYLLYFICFALVGSGIMKILNAEEMGAMLGNTSAPVILAVVEFLIMLAILLPQTRMLGILLAASYFGGAICAAWLIEGEFPIAAMVINTLLYLGAYLYRPSLGDGSPVPPVA